MSNRQDIRKSSNWINFTPIRNDYQNYCHFRLSHHVCLNLLSTLFYCHLHCHCFILKINRARFVRLGFVRFTFDTFTNRDSFTRVHLTFDRLHCNIHANRCNYSAILPAFRGSINDRTFTTYAFLNTHMF